MFYVTSRCVISPYVTSSALRTLFSTLYQISLGLKINTKQTTISVAFSPQANYTDWATAGGRRGSALYQDGIWRDMMGRYGVDWSGSG
jgi:hypothetical protein